MSELRSRQQTDRLPLFPKELDSSSFRRARHLDRKRTPLFVRSSAFDFFPLSKNEHRPDEKGAVATRRGMPIVFCPCRMFNFFMTKGRRLNGFLGLSLNDRTILFLVNLLDKTVSVG